MNTIEDILTINHKMQMKRDYIELCEKHSLEPDMNFFEKDAQTTLGY